MRIHHGLIGESTKGRKDRIQMYEKLVLWRKETKEGTVLGERKQWIKSCESTALAGSTDMSLDTPKKAKKMRIQNISRKIKIVHSGGNIYLVTF